MGFPAICCTCRVDHDAVSRCPGEGEGKGEAQGMHVLRAQGMHVLLEGEGHACMH